MYDFFYRRYVYPYYDRKRGRNLIERLERMKARLSQSPEAIQAERTRLLQEMLVHAASTCPYWARRFQECGVDPREIRDERDLLRLPLLEKDDIRLYGSEMLSSAIPKEQRRASMTGGSTAAPLTFYRDLDCDADREANRWIYYDRMGRSPYDRWGLVWGAMRDLGSYQSLRNKIYQRYVDRHVVLPGNRLTPETLFEFAGKLRRFGAKFLHGYTASIDLLAREMLRHQLKVPSVRSVSVTAEPCSDEQRERIAAAFDCPVYNMYGAREFGFIASAVANHDGMYLNPLNAITEVIGSDGQPAREGEVGQVVVTDLLNRAMPLIRYRIGDVASAKQRSPQTGAVESLEVLAGRDTDFIVTTDGKMVSGAAMTLINAPGVTKLRYLQDKAGELTVQFVKSAEFSSASEEVLRKTLKDVLGPQMTITLTEVPELTSSASGKYEYVRSTVSRNALAISPSNS